VSQLGSGRRCTCNGLHAWATAGTSMRYKPGLISGGRALTHDCGTARGLGYFLEPLLCLALFGKKVNTQRLRGGASAPPAPVAVSAPRRASKPVAVAGHRMQRIGHAEGTMWAMWVGGGRSRCPSR
jgi:hypothetical protein